MTAAEEEVANEAPTRLQEESFEEDPNPEVVILGSSAATAAADKGSSNDVVVDSNNDIHQGDDQLIIRNLNRKFCSNWKSIVYLSMFSVIGVTCRSFLGRLFGGDCDPDHAVKDWLYPLSKHICVTTNGRTEQYGGALFIDLPANMLGSFIIGFFTGHSSEWPAIPFLKHDHPLQRELGLHLGIRTALCGSLTTFSSWNSQMVLMMDGTANPYLGSQVIAALFGYVIGLQVAVMSFRFGRTLCAWTHKKRNPHLFNSDFIPTATERQRFHDHYYWLSPATVLLCIATLFALFLSGDFYWGINYYRELWIACLMAPFGTMLRWKLSIYNGKCAKYPWFPLGTWLANFTGSIVSAALTAQAYLHLAKDVETADALMGLSIGFAGSLSTVSTYVKEIVELADKNQFYSKKGLLYSYLTILSCMFVGLLVYSPMVRYA